MNALLDYQAGVEYEKWICQKLWLTHGQPDQDLGDTACGVEIKLDRGWHTTGNIFFETEQKPIRINGLRSGDWKPCGVFKKCRRYLIGDYSRAILFDGNSLRSWFSRNQSRLQHNVKTGKTFRGYAIPYNTVRPIALHEYYFSTSLCGLRVERLTAKEVQARNRRPTNDH